MKLSNISKLHTNILSEEEGLQDIDNDAKSELEGVSLETPVAPPADENMANELENESELDYNPKSNQINKPNSSGFTLQNVTDQLDGIVKNWFNFAVEMNPDAKEKFLALGERISEISDIVKKEFNNV
jgi:hypothetical protein